MGGVVGVAEVALGVILWAAALRGSEVLLLPSGEAPEVSSTHSADGILLRNLT